MIDTLKYTRELESAGLNSEQAERMVRAQMNMITDSVATKADLYELRLEMNKKFTQVDSRFAKVDARIDGLEKNLIIRLGGIMVSCSILGFGGIALLL